MCVRCVCVYSNLHRAYLYIERDLYIYAHYKFIYNIYLNIYVYGMYMQIVTHHYCWHESILKLDPFNSNSKLFLWHSVTGISWNFRTEKNPEDRDG